MFIVRHSCGDTTEVAEESPGRTSQRSPRHSTNEILARSYCWWSHMDQDIEALVQACQPYQLVKNIPFVSLLHPWLWASKPWVCVHIDLAGPFQKKIFILVLDFHSKWPEIIEMPSITTSKTIINSFFIDLCILLLSYAQYLGCINNGLFTPICKHM